MIIKIANFKAIKTIEQYKFAPIMVFSGANSGGKTSFIQLLLLLKQTLENRTHNAPLLLNKPYVSLGNYKDIIYGRDLSRNIELTFDFDAKDIMKYQRLLKRVLKSTPIGLTVCLELSYTTKIYVQRYSIIWKMKEKDSIWINFNRKRSYKYEVTTNSPLFYNYEYFELRRGESVDIYQTPTAFDATVSFSRMFPVDFSSAERTGRFSPLANNYVENIMGQMFERISYLGPLRDEPHSYYFNDEDAPMKIGNKGEFAAHVVAEHANDIIKFNKIRQDKDGSIEYDEVQDTLEDAVKYWVCDVFGLAKNLKVIRIESGAMYKIELTNNAGIKTSITHVGFGVSQIFPIIVEGLMLDIGGVFILEQPEIHLHPKIQSLLFDFVYSLTLQGKSILIETHSDHFITRLRRRVAEDETSSMAEEVSLTFIEEQEDGINHYQTLNLNDLGTLEYWPKGFFDQHDQDIRAIVKAQSKKRLRSRDKGEVKCRS